MACQPYRLFGDLFADAANLKDNSPWLDDRYVVIDSTLTTTHTGLCRLGRDRLIREYANPYFTTALHKAGERNTCRLDLAGLQPARFQCLQAKLTESERAAALGSSFHTTAM